MSTWAIALALALAPGAPSPAMDQATAKGALSEVASGDRATWVAHPGKGLLRLDLQRGRVTSRLDVGLTPVAVAALHGRVWSVDFGGVLARVDEVENRVERRVRLGFGPTDVAVSERSVWVIGQIGQRQGHPADAVLVRVDPETARIRGVFHLGTRAAPRLVVGHGAVWLAFHPRSRRQRIGLVAIEERTGRLRFRRRIAGAPAGLAAGREGVWVLAQRRHRSRLVLLEARAGTRVRAIRGPAMAGDVAAAADLVWVSALCGGRGCDISRASMRGHEQRSGRLVAGPFPTRCGPRRRGQFLSGVAAFGRSALLIAGDGGGRLALVIVLPRRGVVRCVAL